MSIPLTSLTNRQTFNPKSSNAFKSSQNDMKTFKEFRESSSYKKKQKLKEYEMKLIEIKKRRQALKRKTFDEEIKKRNEIKSKEIQNDKLKKNISAINSEINELLAKLETNKEKERISLNSKKEKYLNQIRGKVSSLREIRKQINQIKQEEKERKENELMLEEEIYQSKRQLLNLTSKMESHTELISELETKSANRNTSLILTPKTNFELTNDFSSNQFKSLNKHKLWSLFYDKIKIFREKVESPRFQEDLSFSKRMLSSGEIDNEKENFVKKMIQIEEVNLNPNLIQNITPSSDCSQFFHLSDPKFFSDLIQKFLNQIETLVPKKGIILKNSQFESDLKILLLSHIKLLIYEDMISKHMNQINRLKADNTVSTKYRENNNYNQQICKLYSKISKKLKKISKYKEKLQEISNDEISFNRDEEINMLDIKSMEKDLESMKKLQQKNEIEIEILKNELKIEKVNYEEKYSYYKIKKRKIKDKIKVLQENIEENVNKIEDEMDIRDNIYNSEKKINSNRDCFDYGEYNLEKFEIKNNYEKMSVNNHKYNEYAIDAGQDSCINIENKFKSKFKYDNKLSSESGKANDENVKVITNYYNRTFNTGFNQTNLTANFNKNSRSDSVPRNIQSNKSNDEQRNKEKSPYRNKKNFIDDLKHTDKEPNRNKYYQNKLGVASDINQFKRTINKGKSGNSSNSLPKNKTTPDFNKNKLGNDIFYNNNNNIIGPNLQREFSLLDKIRPLLLGNTVYKRYYVNINKRHHQNFSEDHTYNPVDFQNGKINCPEDFNFFKCFLCVDRSITKLLFNKIKEDDKSFEINLTSISKIIVPKTTKDVIFIKQIYKKIYKNKFSDANKYIEKNLGKLVKMYHFGINSELAEIDEKLFDEEYRILLLNSNKFMLYIYLKPDEETRIELIFNDYEEFKHWLNGMENILKNKEIKEFIKKKI